MRTKAAEIETLSEPFPFPAGLGNLSDKNNPTYSNTDEFKF
jgi:hypothetical protein